MTSCHTIKKNLTSDQKANSACKPCFTVWYATPCFFFIFIFHCNIYLKTTQPPVCLRLPEGKPARKPSAKTGQMLFANSSTGFHLSSSCARWARFASQDNTASHKVEAITITGKYLRVNLLPRSLFWRSEEIKKKKSILSTVQSRFEWLVSNSGWHLCAHSLFSFI